MTTQTFLNGRVTLHAGDCLDVLRTMPDASVDSCVTDPPYGIGFMGKAWDSPGSFVERKPVRSNKWDMVGGNHNPTDAADAARTRGVQNRRFEAFMAEVSVELFRVLKPGGHLLAFGGTRTYHRLVCAIEDAGFEIRDQIAWVYGSGFPKSHNISKAIDKVRDDKADVHRVCAFVAVARDSAGKVNREIDALFGFNGMAAHWTNSRGPQAQVPRWEQWLQLKEFLDFGDDMDTEVWRLNGRKGKPGEAWDRREVVGRAINGAANTPENAVRLNASLEAGGGRKYDITAPATEAARQWEGWGSALKPAMEPICVARKPLIGTLAENVLAYGTGGLNVDGCRIESGERPSMTGGMAGKASPILGTFNGPGPEPITTTLGRWPANLVHDGSEEVVAAFPDNVAGKAGMVKKVGGHRFITGDTNSTQHFDQGTSDSGSAARFYYSSKADSDDRLGFKHPTIKPVDLMQWLVRLVTPPGGLVLDPFAGTGTTGEAAWREGMRAVLIEREPEYQGYIAQRMALCLAGPDERRRETIKEKLKDKPQDAGPLFGGLDL